MERSVTQALDVRNVHASRGSVEVLRGVTIDVAPGEVCALMGTSGAGKTTMLRAIAALGPFDSGSITVDGFALAPGPVPPESRLRVLRRSVGMVFQAQSLFEHLTVMDNVTLALVHARTQDAAERAVREVQAAYRIAAEQPAARPMIYKTIRP